MKEIKAHWSSSIFQAQRTPGLLRRLPDSLHGDIVVDLDKGMHQGPGAVIRLIVEK